MMAMRALKRRLSNVVFAKMLADQTAREQGHDVAALAQVTGPGGHSGHDSDSSATGSHPETGSSDQPLPGPVADQLRTSLPAVS